MATPLADIVEEASRIAARAAGGDVTLRVTGGVGVALCCPSAGREPLRRPYADVDLVGRAKERPRIVELLARLGYQADAEFNALHGSERLFFWDGANGRQIDVFLDRVEMCHSIDLGLRLAIPGQTLAPADLLLMKLQIVETNEKDMRDILALFVDQPLTEDDSGINLPYVTALAAADWGLWKTITMVAERAQVFARTLPGFREAAHVHEQVGRFLEALDEAPKTRAWKIRAKIGERKRWYELPEEARH